MPPTHEDWTVSGHYAPLVKAGEAIVAIPLLQSCGSQEELLARARLIAAAPALLATLLQLVADWALDEINQTDHWEAARAAIAQAEGE